EQGGRRGGWGLLVLDRKPVVAYTLTNQPKFRYRVASTQALSTGKHTIRLDFKYDGGGIGKGGVATLIVDGKQVAQGRIESTIRTRFSLDETMDFGEDTGSPVVEEYAAKMPYKFTGTVDKFTVHPGECALDRADV